MASLACWPLVTLRLNQIPSKEALRVIPSHRAPLLGTIAGSVRKSWIRPTSRLSRPREEHRASFGYVWEDEVQPWSSELIVHEKQRKPKLAAGVMDTG